MESNSLYCCCVCDQLYNDSLLPRNLKCGHSVCSRCLNSLIPISKSCPECRERFKENSADQLPINYPLLRMSRLYTFRNVSQDYTPNLTLPLKFSSNKIKDAGQCPIHQQCTLFFMCIRCSVFVCRDCVRQDHPDPPIGRCLIMDVGEAIRKTRKSHITIMDEYTAEATTTKSDIERASRLLSKAIKYFSGDSECISNTNNIGELTKHRDASVTEMSNLQTVVDPLAEMKERLKNVDSPQEFLQLMNESTELQLAFEEYRSRSRLKTANVLEIILGPSKNLKKLLEEGKPVYAVYEQEENEDMGAQWAPVKCEDGHLLLYSLRDGPCPEEGIKIPFEVLRDLVPKESPWVFMEVATQGEMKGRVYVRMFGDTPRGRQVLYLCTGEKGPSYRNTCFYRVNTEDGWTSILGGDYENNDGTGGRAIVEGIVSGYPYSHEIKAGLFVSFSCHETWHLANFDIYLADGPEGSDASAHGIVEEGLDILQAAADITPVNDSSVIDCGAVIPL